MGTVEIASQAATDKNCIRERRGTSNREERTRLLDGYGEGRQRSSDQSGPDDKRALKLSRSGESRDFGMNKH
jgi:hypothetical protein